MIRKFLLPALVAATLLAGCASYQYRGGSGDYYYGRPAVEYRYYGSPYGSYGYGYPGWNGGLGYGYSPYGYGYYGYPYYRDGGHHRGDRDNDRARPPWRDLGAAGGHNGGGQTTAPTTTVPRVTPTVPRVVTPTPRPRTSPNPGRSRMGEIIRRKRLQAED